MELMILNEAFQKVGIIDSFVSLIWVDRFYEAGDFELEYYPDDYILSILNQGVYAAIEESEHIMVIEDMHIKTDPVDGNTLITKGRSFESTLDRRIVWDPITFDTEPIQYAIFTLLTDGAINPTDPVRKINNLVFEVSDDPVIKSIKYSGQFWGEYLYNAIVSICFSNNLGFKLVVSEDPLTYTFKLFYGVDRSYDQTDNPYVVFSPNFENLKNSEYILSRRLLKTVTLTAGAVGVGNAQLCVEVDPSQGYLMDLDRREMFLDAQGVSTTDIYGMPLSDEEYYAHLYQASLEELSKTMNIETFASEIDPTNEFRFGKDFFLGDILQVSNEYGFSGKSQVIELVRSQNQSGLTIYPIFRVVPPSQVVDEEVYLGKSLEAACPKNISESIVLGKKAGLFYGMNEVIDFVIYRDLYANGRFD